MKNKKKIEIMLNIIASLFKYKKKKIKSSQQFEINYRLYL